MAWTAMRAQPWTAAILDCRRRPMTVLAASLGICLLSLAWQAWTEAAPRSAIGGLSMQAGQITPSRLPE